MDAPYWGNNVGDYVDNANYFSGGTGPGYEKYYGSGTSGTSAVQSFYFADTGSSNAASFKIAIAGYAGSNILGWYDASKPFDLSTAHVLFKGVTSSTSVTFTPTTDYGLFLESNGSPNEIFLTDMQGNKIGTNGVEGDGTQFAVFGGPNAQALWVGVEDFSLSGSTDKDYNDLVVEITSVPEPATLLFLGVGLFGFGMVRKKMKK